MSKVDHAATPGKGKVGGGMTRDELEEAAAFDGSKRSPNMSPKDAATLIILDGKGSNPKVLMGRRHEGHKFMPGLFVFPGGKVDRHDGSVQADTELNPVTQDKIFGNLRRKPTRRRARALGLACIRETYEEAGLFLGTKALRDFKSRHPDWQAFEDRKHHANARPIAADCSRHHPARPHPPLRRLVFRHHQRPHRACFAGGHRPVRRIAGTALANAGRCEATGTACDYGDGAGRIAESGCGTTRN